MMDNWQILWFVAVTAAIIYLISKAVFAAYFDAKERFVERLMTKQKGPVNGKDSA